MTLSHCLRVLLIMDYVTGLLVFTFLVGCFALPTPEDDTSIFFEHVDRNARIVGGIEAAEGSHPHMVAMASGVIILSFHCGGSLVSQRSVLTAAHCIDAVYRSGSLSSSLRVIVGTNQWNNGGQIYAIERNVTHESWRPSIIKNDIGLLITSTDVVLSEIVQPVPITYEFIPQGVDAIVAGWGRIRAGGVLASTLLELSTTTLDGDECASLVAQAASDFGSNAPAIQSDVEVCTFHASGFGTCNGDSGSALRRADNGQQFGIVSWGFPCARGAPDMFVRVSAFQSWLENHLV